MIAHELVITNCGRGQQTPPNVVDPDVDSQLCVEGHVLEPDPVGEQSIFRSPLLSFKGSPALHKTVTTLC